MATDQDFTAAKLKGYTHLIRFKCGHEIFVDYKTQWADQAASKNWRSLLTTTSFNGQLVPSNIPLLTVGHYAFRADDVLYVMEL